MENTVLHRRESLVLTAIDVINELGIQGLSIREVANRQKITNAAIFSHFKSKSDLIHAVLDHFTQYDDIIKQAIKLKNLHGNEAILYDIDSYYTYYEGYPAITSIILACDGLRCEPDFRDKVEGILLQKRAYLNMLIGEAQERGELRTDIDRKFITDMINGTCREVCLNWRLCGYEFPLKERVMNMLQLILEAFQPRNA
jgi:AcrR family transcriptional regulator